MKIGNIEGSSDELINFLRDNRIEPASIIGGYRSTEVKDWQIAVPAVCFTAGLFFSAWDNDFNQWLKLLVHIITFAMMVIVIVAVQLRWNSKAVTIITSVSLLVMYIMFMNILTPREVIDMAEKHIPNS